MTNQLLSEFMVQRRGPLAKVWLAAHYEKKLTKKEIVTTNIIQSVEAIVSDGSFPKALRLTGQLLIGIVRIYSRKAKYLLDECNEAKISIQMSFRPGSTNVDLPVDQSSALIQQITLSDTVNEIDLLFQPTMLSSLINATSIPAPRPDTPQLSTPLKAQQARPQDITLSESFLPSPEQARRLDAPFMDATLDTPWTDLQLDLDLSAANPTGSSWLEDIELARLRDTDTTPAFTVTSSPSATLAGLGSPLKHPQYPVLNQSPASVSHSPLAPARTSGKRRKITHLLDAVTEIPPEQFSRQLQSTQDLIRPMSAVASNSNNNNNNNNHNTSSLVVAAATAGAPRSFLDDLCGTLREWYPFAGAVSPVKRPRPDTDNTAASTHEEEGAPDTHAPSPAADMWDADDAYAVPGGSSGGVDDEDDGTAELPQTDVQGAGTHDKSRAPASVSTSAERLRESLAVGVRRTFTQLLADTTITTTTTGNAATRPNAARLFYDLLLMKSRGWVHVHQADAYAEMQVTALPLFAEVSVADGL